MSHKLFLLEFIELTYYNRGVRPMFNRTYPSWFQETDDTKKPARQSLAGSIPLGDDDIPKVVNRS